VRLDSLGGELVLVLPPAEAQKPDTRPFLFHGGFFESASYLQRWAALNGGGPDGDRVVIPQMAAGDYVACMIVFPEMASLVAPGAGAPPRDRCASGTLYPGDTLELRLPGATSK
jgi:hypothetical protein